MGAGYKANMEAYYPYDAGVAIDAPLTKDSMNSVLSFVEERCKVEDSATYYLYTVPGKSIEAFRCEYLRNEELLECQRRKKQSKPAQRFTVEVKDGKRIFKRASSPL